MKKVIKSGAGLLLASVATLYAQTPIQIAEKVCGRCHIVSHPTAQKVKEMAAPPMWGIARRLKREFPDQKTFVDFIVDYVQNPSKEKIHINKEAMERFGLMPSLKGVINQEDLRRIAHWLYKSY